LTWKINFNRSYEEGEQFFLFYCARHGSYEPFVFPFKGINYAANFDTDNLTMEEFYEAAATYGIGIVQNLNEAVV
jgi:hypothetical protein